MSNKTITVVTNADYCQFVGLDSQGNVKVWNPADIANVVGGVMIDLRGFDLSVETDVTSAIPVGYIPKAGDKIKIDNATLQFMGSYNSSDINVVYGFFEPAGESFSNYELLKMTYDEFYSEWKATLIEL